jgi:hypothetical protein
LALVALIPVIFVIWERTTFMSSAWIALALSLLLTNIWEYSVKHRRWLQTLVLIVFALWISANTLTLLRRNYWWGQAGAANKLLIEQLGNYVDELPSNAEIWLLNMPDRFGNAFIFRNSFPGAAETMGYQQTVYQVLDAELKRFSSTERAKYISQLQSSPNVIVLFYENGYLITP